MITGGEAVVDWRYQSDDSVYTIGCLYSLSLLVYISLEDAPCAGRPVFDCLCGGGDTCHNRRHGPPCCLPAQQRLVFPEQRTSFAVLRDHNHSPLLQTVDTQDLLNKTTHYTAVLGATASLNFTVECLPPLPVGLLLMSRLQGAIAVYFVGYAMKEVSPPALIPITLLPSHGSPKTVQSDAYRPAGTSNQIVLFNELDPSEIYTITVTKTNTTLGPDVNVDSFILTMPDGADSISSLLGTNFLHLHLHLRHPLIFFRSSNDRR